MYHPFYSNFFPRPTVDGLVQVRLVAGVTAGVRAVRLGPADYLEKKTLELEGRVASPRPEPFHGETGEIERVLKR